jgi:hypothetical protein
MHNSPKDKNHKSHKDKYRIFILVFKIILLVLLIENGKFEYLDMIPIYTFWNHLAFLNSLVQMFKKPF